MKYVVSIITLILLQFSVVEAQNIPPQGTWGIRASIQGSQQNIMVPYRASANVTVSPIFGFESVEGGTTDINFGAHAQFFRDSGSDFASYIGGQLLIHINGDTEILLGGVAGGEYFISRSFSLGVEGQLNLLLDGPTRFGTGAAVAATYYF